MRVIGRMAAVMLGMVLMAAGCARAEALYVQDGVYRIESFAALEEFAELVAELEGGFSGEAWLMKDIEAERPLQPIGSPEHMFLGTFDGRGHVVSKLVIAGENQFQGLFGYVGMGGAVLNLTVRDVFIAGARYTGGIAAYSAGRIENCRAEGGRIAGKSRMDYSTATGGIVGLSGGEIIRCASIGLTVVGRRYVGGVVGSQCAGLVESCVGAGVVRSWDRGQALAGGVAGSVQNGGEIRKCIAAGEVRALHAQWAGGVAGGLQSGEMVGCLSLCRVSGQEAGGVTGYAAQHAQIMSCRYAPWIKTGVGEGRQAGVSEMPGRRRLKVDFERLLALTE